MDLTRLRRIAVVGTSCSGKTTFARYPFSLVFPRAIHRTFRRSLTGERLFAGNRESLNITDPEWIPWWVLRTFWARRRKYPALLKRPEFSHLHVLEFTRQSRAQRFLEGLPA